MTQDPFQDVKLDWSVFDEPQQPQPQPLRTQFIEQQKQAEQNNTPLFTPRALGNKFNSVKPNPLDKKTGPNMFQPLPNKRYKSNSNPLKLDFDITKS